METNRQFIIEREIDHIVDVCSKGHFDWVDLLEETLKNVSRDYHISLAKIKVNMPQTMLRQEAYIVDRTFYDLGKHTAESDVICAKQSPGGGGSAEVTLIAEAGYKWSQTDYKDLNLLLHVSYVHTSQYLATQLLNQTMETDLPTGLYNQTGFFSHLGRCFARGESNEYYVMFFNVRNFKYVNKVFTYQEGDKILSKYGRTIAQLVEGDECIARMGGDNFVAYIHKDNIRRVIEQIDHVVIEHEANNTYKRFEFSATKGIAAMDGVPDCRAIMGHCSLAYQIARRTGKSTVFFSDELFAKAMKQQDVIVRFNDAIDNQEFIVYYQPKVNTEKYELCGAEALVRWMRDGQLHMPMEFVPIYEENGFICRLDYYVLENVCKQLEAWKNEGKELVRVSVNFSRRHLEENHFVQHVADIIAKYDIEPRLIEVELTESDNFQDYSIMSKVVSDLKKIGVSTSIDDFGTGYSSLNMLKSTEFDIVKIDRSFIPQESDSDTQKPKNMLMFRSIMELIAVLGMESIAEGVETKEQLDYFAESKCRMVQGYIFDKPLASKEFEKRLISRKYSIKNC